MPRRAELAGIIRPEVDDRALEQEAQQMESRLGKAAQLTPDIDVRKIQRQLERAIPGGSAIGTAIDAVIGRGGGGGGGGQGGDALSGATGAGIQTAQLETLEDIHDELEKIGSSGGFGTGSGGGEGSGGFLSGITGGAVGRRLPSLTTLAGGVASGASGLAGGAVAGLGLGLGGTRALQETGVMRGVRQGGQAAQSALGSPEARLAASQLVPGDVAALGGAALGLAQGDPKQAAQNAQQASEVSTLGPDDISALRDVLSTKPEFITQIEQLNVNEPSWVSDLSNPQIQEPSWVTTLTTTPVPEPSWITSLQSEIQVEEPPWLDAVSQVGVNLNVDIPTPQLDLGTGTLERELRDELDNVKNDIVDEAVAEIRNVLDLSNIGGP